jgi:hypothetical protein
MADLLGDPRFPEKVMRASRAMKIAYFQGLFKQYSRLRLTNEKDRPIAIAGLESRLRKAFECEGAYGIFDDWKWPGDGLFHRSMLWRRGEEAGDEPLRLTEGSQVPSWSWMAYGGGIDYIDPPFGTADWDKKHITLPWVKAFPIQETQLHIEYCAIPVVVQKFKVTDKESLSDRIKRTFVRSFLQSPTYELVYDTTTSGGRQGSCVVVAFSNQFTKTQDQRSYVLLVVKDQDIQLQTGRIVPGYRRIGVGYMLGESIERAGVRGWLY